MSTQFQLRRGTTAEHASFTGATGEITCDTTKYTAVIHDGLTAGGYPLQKEITAGSGLFFVSNQLNVSGNLITGNSGGAPTTGKYLVLQLSNELSDERLFTPGTGLVGSDAGANGNYTLDFNTGILTGYLLRGLAATTYAPIGSRYLVVTSDPTLTADRVITMGTGLQANDAGANGAYTINFNTGILDDRVRTGNLLNHFTGGTGIGVRLSGASLLVFDYTGTSSAGAPTEAQYLVLGTHPSLSHERVFTAGTGLVGSDAGAGSNYTLNFDTGILTGYLLTGAASSLYAPISSSYIVLSNDSSLTNERAISLNSGLFATDGGANGAYTIGFNTGFITGNITSGNLLSYLIGGTGIAVKQTGTSVVFDYTGSAGGAPSDAEYLTISLNAGLSNERSIAFTSGITATDGGANSVYTIGFDTGFITGNITTGNFANQIISSTGITISSGSNGIVTIGTNSIPSYASPISIQGLAANATASATAIIMLQAQTNTNYRNYLNSGEVLVITNAYMRVPMGTGASNTYNVSGGIRTYATQNASTIGSDLYFLSVTGFGTNYVSNSTGGSYYNPILLLTGGSSPNTNGGWNLLLRNNSTAVRPLSNSGTVYAINGYIVPSGRYP